MSAEVVRVVEARSSVQYDGTNSADVLAAVPDATLVSEDAGVLTFGAGLSEYQLGVGDWFVWRPAGQSIDSGGTYSHLSYTQIFDPYSAA